MSKTLLVDGNNLLKESFHGDKTTYTKWGFIGGIKTFYQSIRKAIKKYQITKIIIFWDGVNSGKLRYDIYPEYKAKRNKNWYGEMVLSDKDIAREENSDKSLLLQRERIKQYAEELFIRQVEDQFCEADDCMAYYVLHLREEDEECIMYSNDRDLCQLITKNVSLYLKTKDERQLVTEENYWLYFNHAKGNSALVKAIEGCTSDNIHGVEGLAEKGLLKHFPELIYMDVTFDHLQERAIEINKGRKKPLVALENLINGKTKTPIENIYTGKHLFELNYKLVNLKEPFITEECIEDLEIQTLYPMSDEDRGGKNLLRLMVEDGFITVLPGGAEGYKDFLVEFIPIVKKEKEKYQKFLQQND